MLLAAINIKSIPLETSDIQTNDAHDAALNIFMSMKRLAIPMTLISQFSRDEHLIYQATQSRLILKAILECSRAGNA
jgi:hypothetical protein